MAKDPNDDKTIDWVDRNLRVSGRTLNYAVKDLFRHTFVIIVLLIIYPFVYLWSYYNGRRGKTNKV